MSKVAYIMENPECCYACPLLSDNEECLGFDTSYIDVNSMKEKPEWCPLVAVPDQKE